MIDYNYEDGLIIQSSSGDKLYIDIWVMDQNNLKINKYVGRYQWWLGKIVFFGVISKKVLKRMFLKHNKKSKPPMLKYTEMKEYQLKR